MVHATWLADRKVRNIQPENGTREKEQKVGKRCCTAPAPFHSMLANPVTPSLVYEVFCEKKVDAEQPYFFIRLRNSSCRLGSLGQILLSRRYGITEGKSVGFNGEMVVGGMSGLEEHLQDLE